MTFRRWEQLKSKDDPTPDEKAIMHRKIWNGDKWYDYKIFQKSSSGRRMPSDLMITKKQNYASLLGTGLDGICYGDRKPVEEILRDAIWFCKRKWSL